MIPTIILLDLDTIIVNIALAYNFILWFWWKLQNIIKQEKALLCFWRMIYPWRTYFNNQAHSFRILVLGLTCLLDCFMYATWILVPLNILKFNFLSARGDYYGTHKWHFLPHSRISSHDLLWLTNFYSFICSKEWKFSSLLAWILGFYSLLGYKEFRYFNLKNLHMLVNIYMAYWF